MQFETTEIEGVYLIKPFHFEDARGSFVKTFHAGEFAEKGLETDFKESFYSSSVRGVIRGMHFQLPPHDHAKIVFATQGEILDVVVDLRKNSATYGKSASFKLTEENKNQLYIPRGLAHGFCALTDAATLFYFVSSVHNKASDSGIRYDSFGFHWPVENPIVSDRDLSFVKLEEFYSPF
ncbi:MAG: dTDP-4-dehydrorhamnose 3,5-epimerase [Flavobacterium sp.]|nr:MAG: dTDP-4-dehydrorhamnose 3,5-epimerase [Flavobacterium sp.]